MESKHSIKKRWMEYVKRKSEATAGDPNHRAKLLGMVVLLLIIAYNIPRAESSFIACGPCVQWAAQFCTLAVAAGGACATVAAFPPALCACLLATSGGVCVIAAGTCALVCLAPTP